MSENVPERLFTLQEAADHLRMSARWLRAELAAGRVPEVTRLGSRIRFTRSQLDALVASYTSSSPSGAAAAAVEGAAPAPVIDMGALTERSARRLASRAVTR